MTAGYWRDMMVHAARRLLVTFSSPSVSLMNCLRICAPLHADDDDEEDDNVDVVVSGLGYGNEAQLTQEASADPVGLLDKFLKKNGADKLTDHTRYSKFMRSSVPAAEEPNCAVSRKGTCWLCSGCSVSW